MLTSEEFVSFACEQNCLERLQRLPPLLPAEALSRLRQHIRVDESRGAVGVEQSRAVIQEFVAWSKKLLGFLEAFKRQVRAMIPVKEAQNDQYRLLAERLGQYEQMSITRPAEFKLLQRVESLASDMRNPFNEMLLWAKEQTMDLHSAMLALAMREQLCGRRQKRDGKRESCKKDLDKLRSGGRTL